MSINSRNGNTLLNGGLFSPVRAASTAALALSGLQTVDGIALADGHRVLVMNQADQTTNGIYAASDGNWVRTSDAASNADFFSGMAVLVALGTVNAGLIYICTCADDPVVIGTSLLTFAVQSAVQTAQQSATSASSLAVGTGAKVFAIPAGKNFSVGQWVIAADAASLGSISQNVMFGQVSSYSGGNLTVAVVATSGSGTFADWIIVLNNSAAGAGFSPPIGAGNFTGPGSSTAGHVVTFADTTGKVGADGGALGALAGLDSLTAKYLAASAIAFGVGMLNGTITTDDPLTTAGALIIRIKTLAGADPSASDPVTFIFRDATLANGDYVVRTVTAALSLTISSGSVVGFANGVAGRLWVCPFDDAGTVRLGVINCLSGTDIYPLFGTHIASTTADDGAGGSSLAQVFYTANGHALTSKAFSVLGYLGSTQATAGTWATAPDEVQLFGPGTKRPGDVVQTVFNSTTTVGLTASATFVALTSGLSQAITPTSAANPIRITTMGTISGDTDTVQAFLQIARGSTLIGHPVGADAETTYNHTVSPLALRAYDRPNANTSQTYSIYGKTTVGNLRYPNSTATGATLELEEIMA